MNQGSYNKNLNLKNIWNDFISPTAMYTNIKYGIEYDMFGAYWWGRLAYTILIFMHGMLFYAILHIGFHLLP